MKAKTLYLIAILFTILCSLFTPSAMAQGVRDLIQQQPSYASCNYHIYPDTITAVLARSPFISPITDVMALVTSIAEVVTISHIG